MENKDYKWLWFLIISISMFALLILLITLRVFWDSCTALSCGSIKMPTVVANQEEIWTHDHELIKLIQEAEIVPEPVVRDFRTTEKEKIVADVIHKEIKWEKYTIRVGLWWGRKPIPPLTGLTTQERAKEWLISQGSTSIKHSLPVWERFWQEYKMDYTLPLCISWADSSLGKALKSKNNLSNYWNNDRGDVRHFDSVEEWIRITFWALAHWKYMSGHEIIGTLSGEGRKIMWLPWCNEEKDYRKKCWATSMVVHSTNVVNCMSAIHNKQIDESFEFRIN